MAVVSTINIKGGVGKTTLLDELAYSLDRTNTRYSLVDMDQQGSLAHESCKAEEDDAPILLDTPAGYNDETRSWASNSDVILVPTLGSMRDSGPTMDTLDLIHEVNPDATILVVVNGWTRYSSSSAFIEWLQTNIDERQQLLLIPHSEMILQAAGIQKSVLEHAPYSLAAYRILAVIQAVRRALGLPEEDTEVTQKVLKGYARREEKKQQRAALKAAQGQ